MRARARRRQHDGGAVTNGDTRPLASDGPRPRLTTISDHRPQTLDPADTHLEEQVDEMALRLECVKVAEEELPLGVAYQRVLEIVRRAVAFEHGTLYLSESRSGRLIPVAIRGHRIDLADQVRFARGPGLSAWVAQEGRPVVIPDPALAIDRSPFADTGLRAFLAFPLVHSGVVVGVVALARGERTFGGDEFARLGRLADPLAMTLSRLRRETRLRELIHLDPETRLSNRPHFLARIEEELQRAQQHASEFSVVMLQLDGISDAARLMGSQTGAQLMGRFTQRLQSALRTCDMAASLDDGRFGLLLAGVSRETAASFMARMMDMMLHDNLQVPRDRLALRLRVGLASFPEVGDSLDDLLQRAAADLTASEREHA